MQTKLYRSKNDRKIAGVCGGLAQYLGFDPTILRLVCALAILFGGLSLWVYIICALIIPEQPDVIEG